MAQRAASVLVTGNVVKSERKHGSMPAPDNPAQTITWDYIEARLLTPEYDTLDVRFPTDGSIPLSAPDELVTLRCEARAANANLRLTVVSVVGSVASLV